MTEQQYDIYHYHILLVDDDEDDYILTREMLEKAWKTKFFLEWAKDYQTAMLAVKSNYYDAVLVDFDLGTRNGIDFISEAIQSGLNEPMILLTGRGGIEIDLEAMQAGAADYLNKSEINASLLERSIRYTVERKRSEQALKQSEERFRLASQAVNGVVYDWSIYSNKIYRSDGLLEMLGYSPDEDVSIDEWMARVHPEDREQLQAVMDHMQHSDQTRYETQYRIQRKDGRWITVQDRSLVVRSASGQIMRVVGSSVDITQHRRDEEQLRYQAMLLESVKDAIIATDVANRITAWNPAAEALYSWKSEDVLGKNLFDILPIEVSTEEQHLFANKSAEGSISILDTTQFSHNGKTVYVEGTMIALRDAQGNISGYVSSHRDVTDRKLAELALQDSEATLRSFFNASGISLAVVEVNFAESNITYLIQNQHSAAFHGLTPSTAALKTASELGYDQKAIAAWLEKYRECANAGEPLTIETDELFNLSPGWYHVTISPIPGGNLLCQRFSLTTVDISDRKKAEEDLRASEERFHLATHTINEGLWDWNLVEDTLWWNDAYDRLYGPRPPYSAETADWWKDRLHPDDRERVLQSQAEVMADKSCNLWSSDYRFQRADGSYAYVTDRSLIARDGQGKAVRITGAMLDLTELKMVEEDLRESEQRFRLALTNSNVSVFTMDKDLRYTWSYGPRWGYSAAELLGRRDDELEGADDVSELLAFKAEVIRTGVGAQAELKARIKGEWLLYHLTLEPLIDKNGEVTGFTAASMDITNLRRLEMQNVEKTTQIEVQRRLIQQREMERMEIARDLHDGPIQELVAAGMKLSEAMLESEETSRKNLLNDLQAILQNQTRELRQFCQELRPPALAPFGLEKAIRSHVQTFNSRAPEVKINLNLMRDGQLLPEETRMALFRVYQEQMNNIFKHSRCEQINIALLVEPDQVTLEIRDDGVGFTLPDNWIKLVRTGHLGLVGMRERIEAINGTMEISSKPGEGTVIRVSAPVVKENQPV